VYANFVNQIFDYFKLELTISKGSVLQIRIILLGDHESLILNQIIASTCLLLLFFDSLVSLKDIIISDNINNSDIIKICKFK
jgi:hypothetical protein